MPGKGLRVGLGRATHSLAMRRRYRRDPVAWRPLAFGPGRFACDFTAWVYMFAYIGYMTFNITLSPCCARAMSAGASPPSTLVLGLGVVASSWLWAGLLQRTVAAAITVLNACWRWPPLLPVRGGTGGGVRVRGCLFGRVPVGGGRDHCTGAAQPEPGGGRAASPFTIVVRRRRADRRTNGGGPDRGRL